MTFKNFLISITKSLIVLFLATLIFSTITIDFPNLMKGVFGDIFSYASPDVQKQVVNKLAETCSSLDQGKDFITINQLCANQTLLESLRENCRNYRELKKKNVIIENEQQVMKNCNQIESGEIEKTCNELQNKKSLLPDFSKIGSICKDYKSGKIDDKGFFYNIIGISFNSQQFELPTIGFLEKYNQAISYLNSNKTVYFTILIILFVILYLLVMDIRLFLIRLGEISFSLGILIMLPYAIILVYDKFAGIDTTPILGSIFGAGASFNAHAIISVILLLFLRTYNSFIITLGIIFLAVGIAGKLFKVFSKKETKPIKPPKGKKIDKLFGELKESMKKKDKRKK